MSTTSIDRSVKAFEDELRRQVAIHGPLTGDPAELGRRVARAVAAGAAWSAEVGPFYDTAGAQEALGGVSKQAVSARATAGRLLALRLAPDGTARDRLVYPVWQFVPAVLRHLPRVLAAAGHEPERDTSGWTIATWLTTPDPRFGDRTPLELLRADHVDQVLAAAGDVAHALGTAERLGAPVARPFGVMTVATGLGEPPEHLLGFPEAEPVAELHRLSEFPGSWWFASTEGADDAGGGRFDLPAPHGTCYLADSLAGAVVEKLLRAPVKVVVAERLDELFHTVVAVRRTPPVADLTARKATGFGLNAEIHTTLDYARTRRWAAAFHRNGFRGLRHRLRGDVSQRLAGWALFGTAGLRQRAPSGMSTSVGMLDRAEVAQVLERLGVELRPIASIVPVVDPPRRRR